jgi:hypothetical protein
MAQHDFVRVHVYGPARFCACPSELRCGSNPEAVAPDLVVNKLVLTVDSRFSTYALCNIGVNGSDDHGLPCATDT